MLKEFGPESQVYLGSFPRRLGALKQADPLCGASGSLSVKWE